MNSQRNIIDGELLVTAALPATASTAVSAGIDLGSTTLGAVAESIAALVKVPATPDLADTKTITVSIQDSADNSSFAAIDGTGSLVLLGAGGTGAAAAELRVKLPTTSRKYVRATATAVASAGDSTGVSLEFSIRT